MPNNFPSSPTIGQIYTENNFSYEFTGSKWKPVNRLDYVMQSSDISTANNQLVVNFNLDNIQRVTISSQTTVSFTNLPGLNEYKKVLLEISSSTSNTSVTTPASLISSAVYDNIFFSVANQDANPLDVSFKPDGTKMYVLGGSSQRVYEYDLSTPWIIGSAVYNSVSFSVGSQEATPYAMFFKPEGDKMYIVGNNSDRVFEYNLSTPWLVSSAVYNNVNFSVAGQDIIPWSVFFKSDGAKMYIMGNTNDRVYEYDLSTPWLVSSAVYNSVSFSPGTQDTDPVAVSFKPDGTKMYILGNTNDRIYEYNLSTPWLVSSAVYNNISFLVTRQESSPYGLFFKPDETKMYIVGNVNDRVHQYSTVAISNALQWPSGIEWESGVAPNVPDLNQRVLVEIEARTDYIGTNYVGRVVGRNF